MKNCKLKKKKVAKKERKYPQKAIMTHIKSNESSVLFLADLDKKEQDHDVKLNLMLQNIVKLHDETLSKTSDLSNKLKIRYRVKTILIIDD